jgi:hypothetical protein
MSLSNKTRCVVWARAAGRCQFPGCNKLLIGDLIAGNDDMNTGYIAHIIAETAGGPRGDFIRSPLLADDPSNLLLLCDAHHRLIDREELVNYPEDRLLKIKSECENRIELLTDIAPDRASHIIRYGSTIGQNESAISFSKCREAMSPNFYPANRQPIDLSMSGLDLSENDSNFYQLQAQNLRRQFEAKVKGRLESQEISHFSVFALAPMPLLIELGRLISDISPANVYQLHREPVGWRWAENDERIKFIITKPKIIKSKVALKIGISAHITDERIFTTLDDDTSIWSIDAAIPHNDCMRYAEDLGEYRSLIRKILNEIILTHGGNTEIYVFPAVPVAAAVELGRVWMPKADLSLVVFDQDRESGGFVQRLKIAQFPKVQF